MTRSLYGVVSKARCWRSWVVLTPLAELELEWWREHLIELIEYPIPGGRSTTVFSFEVASDASEVGNFSYLVGERKEVLSSRPFSVEEGEKSSTWRELTAFEETWTRAENLERFRGSRIAHYTDSKAMAAIVAKGSRKPELQSLVMKAVLALRRYHIQVEAVWRSRDEGIIKWADLGSREHHKDDVELDFDTMALVYRMFGDFDVDVMATRRTSKGRAFFSLRDEPYSAGVDFFHQELKKDKSYFCFAPTPLLRDAVQHFKMFGVCAVMVVPVWASSTFFSVFWPDGTHAAPWVVKLMLVQPKFVPSPRVLGKVFSGRRSFMTAIMKVDFRGAAGEERVGWRDFCLKGGCEVCRGSNLKRKSRV